MFNFPCFKSKALRRENGFPLVAGPRRIFFSSSLPTSNDLRIKISKSWLLSISSPFFLDEKGHAKFPLYWNRFSKSVLSVDCHNPPHLRPSHARLFVRALDKQDEVLSCTDMLKWDSEKVKVLKHLKKFLIVFPFLPFIMIIFLNFL